MSHSLKDELIGALTKRRTSDGGFAPGDGGEYRPDATAWAALALQVAGGSTKIIVPACQRLVADQRPDGRIAIAPSHPEASWPTIIALLAWRASQTFPPHQEQAVQFLLRSQGKQPWYWFKKVIQHNPHLKGWSWISGTSPWVEPTSLAIIALTLTGHATHPRVTEAGRLLLDRQLPQGGWNYGNTFVFDQELLPNPESTGVALNALPGLASSQAITASLAYLQSQISPIRTPLALSWGLLGLGAWGLRPPLASDWLRVCWEKQQQFGLYDTTLVSLLLLALVAPQGLASIIA